MAVDIRKGRYRHYKGNEYQLIDAVTHSETMERLILYRPLYGEGALWVRPFDMFFGTVLIEGKTIDRFEWIAEA